MPAQNEVALLRDQITEEVNRDAEVLGNQLFGQTTNAREPDVSRVSEDQLRAIYRQKFLEQDRQWLGQEAQRDPQQFMRVAQAIGVRKPEDLQAAGLQPQPVPVAVQETTPTPPVTQPISPTQPVPPVQQAVDPALVQQALMAAIAANPSGLAGPQSPPAPPVPVAPQPTVAPPLILPGG